MNIDLRPYHGLLRTLYENRDQYMTNKLKLNTVNVFKGIVGFMPGYWNIIGITRQAQDMIAKRPANSYFVRGIQRDHMKPQVAFYERVISGGFPTLEEFVDLVADYGRTVLVTRDQNPAGQVSYGNTYTDADILWLEEPIDTPGMFGAPNTVVWHQRYLDARTALRAPDPVGWS